MEEQAYKLAEGLIGGLIAHAIGLNSLSLVMGRYRGPRGRIISSIAFHRFHRTGLLLAAAAGVLVAIQITPELLPYQITLAVLLFMSDQILIWKAIKSVDRFSSDLDER